jgi:hypothetical protein
MTIVDSSVWIDYFNGNITRETELLDQLLGRVQLGVGDLIFTEVLQGFSVDADYYTAKSLLETLSFFNFGGKPIAIKGAENYRFLRKKGVTVRKTIDVIIATACLEYDFTLLHADRDFIPFVNHFGLKTL